MQATVRTLADRVIAFRQEAWEESDPTIAIVATEQLDPEDSSVVDRMVAAAGFTGAEGDNMIRKVKSLVVGQVEAQNDSSPSESG